MGRTRFDVSMKRGSGEQRERESQKGGRRRRHGMQTVQASEQKSKGEREGSKK